MTNPIRAAARPARLARVSGLVVAACLAFWASAAVAADAAVQIENFTFSPAELTVSPGTTVTWTNADDIPHLVVSTKTEFKSKALDTNDTFSFTFAKAGEYSYFCALHPHMTGKILVKAP